MSIHVRAITTKLLCNCCLEELKGSWTTFDPDDRDISICRGCQHNHGNGVFDTLDRYADHLATPEQIAAKRRECMADFWQEHDS